MLFIVVWLLLVVDLAAEFGCRIALVGAGQVV
jgi:hypothetical protein